MNTRMKKILGGVSVGAALLTLTACLLPTGNGSGLGPSGDVPPPDTNLTLIQAQIFDQKCADCHGGTTPFMGLNLSSVALSKASLYQNGAWRLSQTAPTTSPRYRILGGTLDANGKVTSAAGASKDSSFLYQKVTAGPYKNGTNGGSRMPLGRPTQYLTDSELELLAKWIEKGASLE